VLSRGDAGVFGAGGWPCGVMPVCSLIASHVCTKAGPVEEWSGLQGTRTRRARSLRGPHAANESNNLRHDAGRWKLPSSSTTCNTSYILSHVLSTPSYVLIRCAVLLHTLTGISPSSQFIVSNRSISQSGLLNANSYLLSTLASTTVCSRYEMLRPMRFPLFTQPSLRNVLICLWEHRLYSVRDESRHCN
jgi:hypothetical protein